MGKTVEWVQNATERDNFLSAEEAKKYGIIDQIFHTRKG
ncbi:MAG: ATP-dependent Clp protease proteolytic subunit, partial [Clostridia bacterium]|nr:ATP-dependent Clp protease proteolytic subunit [Clostridia bacterium]